MKILVYTKFNGSNIQENLGQSEYSYYFVLRKFLPILQEIGEVHVVENPIIEVDAYYKRALEENRKCVFLCFTAPHNSFMGLKCPTIPVFAWEYDTIPNESWDDNEMNDWSKVLRKAGAAITHSNHSVRVVQRELGKNFPIIACPAPMETRHFAISKETWNKLPLQQYELVVTEKVVDSSNLNFDELTSAKGMDKRFEVTHILLQRWSHEVLEDMIPNGMYRFLRGTYLYSGMFVARSLRLLSGLLRQDWRKASGTKAPSNISRNDLKTTLISGVIYTSILNIFDGRKNHRDMIAAFCYALKDCADATLILKTPIESLYFFKKRIVTLFQKLPAFQCRVVVIGYYLDSEAYGQLMKATTFYVNTSFGEGQCLPLMEYMAAGVPAIAPQSTALGDYVFPSNAFTVETAAVPTSWQHDERDAIRTVHHHPDWYSLIEAYRKSYQVAKNDVEIYRKMSANAMETMKNHCSKEVIHGKLNTFLQNYLSEL